MVMIATRSYSISEEDGLFQGRSYGMILDEEKII